MMYDGDLDCDYFVLDVADSLRAWEQLHRHWTASSQDKHAGPPPSYEAFVEACKRFAFDYPHMRYDEVGQSLYKGRWPSRSAPEG